MSRFYIKELSPNELGTPKADGKVSRGRFVYVSKQLTEDFFPHLSKTINNDSALIPVIPPFSNTRVYSKFVYHNDKYNRPEGTRDEFRLYLNAGIDPDGSFYQAGDIVVFERVNSEEEIEDKEFIMPNYFMYRFEPGDAYYETLKIVLSRSDVKGKAHALANDLKISAPETIEARLEEAAVVISDDAKELIEVTTREIEESSEPGSLEAIRGANLFNAVNFRDFVLLAYGYKCAITKRVISWKELNNLEAAHIKPKAHVGTFLPCNGIALSRDMHWAFDKGLLTINDEFKVVIHGDVMHTYLGDFHGEQIIVPTEPYFQPAKQFLAHHRELIFGLFKHSGVIRSL